MMYQYMHHRQLRLVLTPLGDTALTLPVSPALYGVCARLVERYPDMVMETLLDALKPAREWLEQFEAALELSEDPMPEQEETAEHHEPAVGMGWG